MGFLDDAKDKASDLAAEHPDQVSEGIDKAADAIDEKTGGRFTDQIDSGAEQAKEEMGVQDAGGDEGGNG